MSFVPSGEILGEKQYMMKMTKKQKGGGGYYVQTANKAIFAHLVGGNDSI